MVAVVFIHMRIVIMKTVKTIMKISIHIGPPPSAPVCAAFMNVPALILI